MNYFKSLYFVIAVMVTSTSGFASDETQAGWIAYHRNDYATALREFRVAALRGEAEAQWRLGLMYATGRGVTKDETLAVTWFRKSAEQGDARGQFLMAHMYQRGLGVKQDESTAASW